MPNITSVDRLKAFYRDDKNVFVVLLIDYSSQAEVNYITNVRFIPIEFYSWDCLTIGALGTGQIQIRRASEVVEIIENSRKAWMLECFDRLNSFYINEVDKTVNRLKNTDLLKDNWKVKEDTWI